MSTSQSDTNQGVSVMSTTSSSRSSRLRGLRVAVAAAAAALFALVPTAAASAQPLQESPSPAADGLIDPGLLESVQRSIVGIVVTWEEPEDPYAWASLSSEPSGSGFDARPQPAVAVCTGWFAGPTTIVTAGHCVDPAEGRLILDMWNGLPADPQTGLPAPVPAVRPEPKRTVYAFQPRELPGAVLTAPTIVRVDDFRAADEGDTARLEVYGMPPGTPLPVAPDAPRLGDGVTSIGFPGLNIADTDGVDLDALIAGDKNPAEVLQDSRLQPANTSGTIIARQYREGVAVYQVSSDFDHGMSGGPTLNNRGQVLGINSQMTVPFLGQNFNIATDTATLRHYLAGETSTDRDAATNTTTGQSAGSTATLDRESEHRAGWIALGAGLAATAIGGVVLWRRKRSAAGTELADVQGQADQRPTTAADEQA